MKIKNVLYLIVLIIFVSCSLLESRKQIFSIQGKVYTTDFGVPVPSNLSFYSKNKLIKSINTDYAGKYEFSFQMKYLKKECTVIIQALKNDVYMDTIIKEREITGIEVSGFKVDTFSLNLENKVSNFRLKYEYQTIVLEGEVSD